MEIALKTAFYCYPSYEKIIFNLEQVVEKKAICSYSNPSKTLKQMEEIILINEKIAKLTELKCLISELLNRLSDEERLCVEYRFFKRFSAEIYDSAFIYKRYYYKKINRAFSRMVEEAYALGLDVDWLTCRFNTFKPFADTYKKLKNNQPLKGERVVKKRNTKKDLFVA